MTYPSFSQTDTIPKKIQLTERVAKEIIKDLIRGDRAIEEVKILNSKLTLYDNKFKSQNDLIKNLNLQTSLLEDQITLQRTQYEISNKQNQNLNNIIQEKNKKLKTQKLTMLGVIVVGVVGIILK